MGTYFSVEYMLQALPVLLSYMDVTVLVTVLAEAAALALGCAAALARIHRLPGLQQLSMVYISFVRGTPFLVQLYLICFGLPQLMQAAGYTDIRSLPVLLLVLVVMALHSGAYVAEILRGSILALPAGQMEAALSVGMSRSQAYRRIVLPQAFRLAIPALGNEVISALKNTSLVFNVGVVDMLSKAELMGSFSYRNLELYLDVGLVYILLCFAIHGGTMLLENCRWHSVRRVRPSAAAAVES